MTTVGLAKEVHQDSALGHYKEKQSSQDYQLKISIWDFIRWPIRTTLNLVRTRMRFVLLCPRFLRTQVIYDRVRKMFFTITIRDSVDFEVIEQVYLYEEYGLSQLDRCTDILKVYRDICSKNHVPLILDLGAHIGLASKYFSGEFPRARIIAVEPDADNLAAASMNLKGETNVSFVHAGVSCASGQAKLLGSELGSWAHRTERCDKGPVELISIDSLLEKMAIAHCTPFIVKIDIEGFENDLFKANTGWVDRFPLLIIELHDWLLPREGNSGNFLKCIAALNRDFVHINENIFSIKN